MRDINADPFRQREHTPVRKLDPVGSPNDFRKSFSVLFDGIEGFEEGMDDIGKRIISADANRRRYERQMGFMLVHAIRGNLDSGDDYGVLVEFPKWGPSGAGPEALPLAEAA